MNDYLFAGHEVRTGKYANGRMVDGAPVDLELRTARNEMVFRISKMPDT